MVLCGTFSVSSSRVCTTRGQASEGACEEDVTTWHDPAVRNEETLKRFCGREFPDVSELDSSFYPSDRALSSLMYRSMIIHRQTHIDQERVLRLVRFKWE